MSDSFSLDPKTGPVLKNNHNQQDDSEKDPLYDEAVAVILKNKRASISLVQRHLRVGYNRAARLLDAMEAAGVVSQMQSNGNREILVSSGK